MRVLGVDPGTETTGLALIYEDENGKLVPLHYGVIITSQKETSAKRLQIIYNELNEIITLHRPDTGAVEKLFFQKNVTNAIAVGQARGVVLLSLAQAELTVAEYSPQEVKLAVTGYGNAEKKQVQLMVKTILGLKDLPRPDDAADALAIAICHIHTHNPSILLSQGV
jgi:crossover junction endodeoxyribonuclease RuvC